MYLCGRRYRVIRKLGEGGFSKVYLVEDQVLKNTWAVKEIGESDQLNYFAVRAEISVLSKVSHPGIVRITDVFSSNGHIYIVMDHIRGRNLQKILKSCGKLQEKLVFNWGRELCEAVAYLHSMEPPVIIGDLKPQNIMVRPDGHIVLIDFGAASTEHNKDSEGFSFATKKWAAPEQIKNGTSDKRSDIYSLGRVLDAISGKDKPLGMDLVIKRCTMKDPRFRYRSAGGVMRDLAIIRNLGKIAAGALILLLAAGLITAGGRAGRAESVRDTGSIEAEKNRQSYDQALRCFYDLQDYDGMALYLGGLSEEEYPEKDYYLELSRMLSGETDEGNIGYIIERFEEFNERDILPEDRGRYIKNAFCIVKAWLSCETEDRYDRAYAGILKIMDHCGEEEIYRKDAKKLAVNILILKGREKEEDRSSAYHEAIEYMEKLLSESGDDKEEYIARKMDEAELYSELGEYEKALDIYADTEAIYPLDPAIRYFAHLSLLMQTEADRAEVEELWERTEEVEGIKEDVSYSVMKERVAGYHEDKNH